MKKSKMILGAIAVLAIAGSAFAVNKARNPQNLWEKRTVTNGVCIAAPAGSVSGFSSQVSPDLGYTGFYTTSACTGTVVPGYSITND